MRVAGRYRVVCRQDHAMPEVQPRPLLGREHPLDVRAWRRSAPTGPLLLVNASRKQGRAVQRNRFRRRVRMAFLNLVRENAELQQFDGIVWVRPSRTAPRGCPMSFQEIEGQLRLALSRRDRR